MPTTPSRSEDMLWLHVRSAVTIFGKLLSTAFHQNLPAAIPSRVIPITALPPPTLAPGMGWYGSNGLRPSRRAVEGAPDRQSDAWRTVHR